MNKKKRSVPAFATEAEEAAWWYRKRNAHGAQLQAAVNSGEARKRVCVPDIYQIPSARDAGGT